MLKKLKDHFLLFTKIKKGLRKKVANQKHKGKLLHNGNMRSWSYIEVSLGPCLQCKGESSGSLNRVVGEEPM